MCGRDGGGGKYIHTHLFIFLVFCLWSLAGRLLKRCLYFTQESRLGGFCLWSFIRTMLYIVSKTMLYTPHHTTIKYVPVYSFHSHLTIVSDVSGGGNKV